MARAIEMTRRRALLLSIVAAFAPAAAARAIGDPETAALQVALRARNLYAGDVDGVYGPATLAAVSAFQRQVGIPVTGFLSPPTRAAFGVRARSVLGSRLLKLGTFGWDVAELQFLLAWHGFPSGSLDGEFSTETYAALVRFQQWAGLAPDGVAGPAALGALQGSPPTSDLPLAWPLALPVGDRFGSRGGRFHAGIDIPAPLGTAVAAAASGRVVYAGWRDGGWGIEVTIASGGGTREIYAHLAEVVVQLGSSVARGEALGLVGATGDASGPHLHFEVRVRGAAVDPLASLPPAPTPPSPSSAPTHPPATPAPDNDRHSRASLAG